MVRGNQGIERNRAADHVQTITANNNNDDYDDDDDTPWGSRFKKQVLSANRLTGRSKRDERWGWGRGEWGWNQVTCTNRVSNRVSGK